MQDLELLSKRGATPEKLKAKLTAPVKDPKVKRLLELHEQRMVRYISRNMQDSRIYWTLDRIIDSSLRNVKYVQAREILESQPMWETEKLSNMFMDWGLHQMLVPAVGADGKPILGANNTPMLELNMPIFDRIYVPLVMSYRTMRWARIFNQRNTYPLYKYSPSHATTKHLAQTEVITSIIARQSVDMAHSQDLKQSILQMLDYGFALRMPSCAWHREEYQTTENGKPVLKTQREGMKWVIPRPERTFIDGVNPLSSLNSDTGCSFFGYWDLKRYGELKGNDKLWNLEKVNFGSSQAFFKSSAWGIYQELFPCTLKVPTCIRDVDYATIDRQDKEFWYSASAEEDAATIVTVMFDKIIPSEWNLFDYDYPVWMRFLYGDTCTPLYAEALPYTPGAIYLYDYDANRGFQNSLTMQLSPYQQMFGNFLTQYYISVRNNLPRIVFYNTDIVDKDHIAQIKAEKSRLYQQLTFLPFSKRDQSFQQQGQQDAFFPVVYPQTNTQELAGTLRMTIELLERMLGYPSQEVGAPATHEQTAREVIIVDTHSNTRSDFTSDGVDQAEKAVKKILYEGWVAYGSDEVSATVIGISEELQKVLKDLGFEIEPGESNKQNTFGVKGPKSALLLSDFATDQTGSTRSEEPKVAIAMMQSLQVALQNPVLFQAVGVEQVVQLINDVFVWAGLPEDFRLRVDPKYKSPQEQQQEFVQALQKAKEEILKAAMEANQKQLAQVAEGIKKEVVQPVQETFSTVGQRISQMEAHSQQRDQILSNIMQVIGGNGNGSAVPPPVPAGIPPEVIAAAIQKGAQQGVPPEAIMAAVQHGGAPEEPMPVPPGAVPPGAPV